MNPYSQLESNFKSSYNRSFGRENILNHPLTYFDVKREAGRKIGNPVFQEKYSSTYKESFGCKRREGVNYRYHQRSSVNWEPNLKRLNEDYLERPPRPHQTGLTTTGRGHGQLKPFHNFVDFHQSKKNHTCPLKLRSKDQFIIPSQESSFQKLLDIYATTVQLTHTDFFGNQKNVISNNFNDKPVDKNRGLQKSYSQFNPQEKTLYRQFPRTFSRLPHSGNISTYKKDYKQTFSCDSELDSDFPILCKLTKSDIFTVPGMYSTENCHLGTGWPVRAAVGI